LKRAPERVARDVNKKWLSLEKAASIYGVALILSKDGIDYEVDAAATRRLREERART
jgi:N-methylhydantoinase B/oxoprolinase/acetone carboxylase alpha subunit